MRARRRRSMTACAALLFVFTGAPGGTRAQPVPAPPGATASPPPSSADRNRAILMPLVEIGRVRARTPYCAALARARDGSDAAVAFEYQAPVLASDLARFRLDNELAKHQSLRKTERDLNRLWDLAVAGRDEVRKLRDAANAPGVDDERRNEMLALANALDGAKARQMELARSIARAVGTLAERPVTSIVNNARDQAASSSVGQPPAQRASLDPTPPPAVTLTQSDAIEVHERLQLMFTAFNDEESIRDDLRIAAGHATAAMKLGACSL